ncbi:hypothetical protein QQ045_017518 [Rhodiola kirilowii]
MEALPIFLDGLVTAWGAILMSVTLIQLVGDIIPQSVCSRYGLSIGADMSPVVRILVWICYPVTFPISKLLEYLLDHKHRTLFRRVELKRLVNFHGNEIALRRRSATPALHIACLRRWAQADKEITIFPAENLSSWLLASFHTMIAAKL